MSRVNWIRVSRQRSVSQEYVVRYVITHVGKYSMRTLAQSAQGRYTYATEAEAQTMIDAMMANNSRATLESVYGLPLEVRPCKCYPGHFDPQSVYFD
jgi:hypothetical protein